MQEAPKVRAAVMLCCAAPVHRCINAVPNVSRSRAQKAFGMLLRDSCSELFPICVISDTFHVHRNLPHPTAGVLLTAAVRTYESPPARATCSARVSVISSAFLAGNPVASPAPPHASSTHGDVRMANDEITTVHDMIFGACAQMTCGFTARIIVTVLAVSGVTQLSRLLWDSCGSIGSSWR